MSKDTTMHTSTVINRDGKLMHHQYQNVKPIMERAKLIRDEQRGKRCRDNHFVASIPYIVIEQLMDRGLLGKDFFTDKGQKAKLLELVKKHYPEFMCTEKNIVMKPR
jgi:hypothetical protein